MSTAWGKPSSAPRVSVAPRLRRRPLALQRSPSTATSRSAGPGPGPQHQAACRSALPAAAAEVPRDTRTSGRQPRPGRGRRQAGRGAGDTPPPRHGTVLVPPPGVTHRRHCVTCAAGRGGAEESGQQAGGAPSAGAQPGRYSGGQRERTGAGALGAGGLGAAGQTGAVSSCEEPAGRSGLCPTPCNCFVF